MTQDGNWKNFTPGAGTPDWLTVSDAPGSQSQRPIVDTGGSGVPPGIPVLNLQPLLVNAKAPAPGVQAAASVSAPMAMQSLEDAGLLQPVTSGSPTTAAFAKIAAPASAVSSSAPLGLSPLMALGLGPRWRFEPVEYDPWKVAKGEQLSGDSGPVVRIPSTLAPRVAVQAPAATPVVLPSAAQGAGVPYMTFVGKQSAWNE